MAVAFYINSEDCYGCQTCQVACKAEQRTSSGVNLRKVHIFNTEKPVTHATLSLSCNHCADPLCLNKCPAGAYVKLANGIVYQHHDLCVGCKMCFEVCPYGAPQYDPEEKKTVKCSYCFERLQQGLGPCCAEACPGGNIQVGEMADLLAIYSGVNEIPCITPSASITNPSILINPATPLKKYLQQSF